MEDLGHIDININDRGGAGGRGTGGTPGSGPSAMTLPASSFAPLTAAQQALAQRITELRQNIRQWQLTTARIQSARVGQYGESIGEIRDFFSRPTIAGFRSLTSNATATGTMLGRLAASSPRLALFATGLLGAVGGIMSFVSVMKRANEAIQERIVELTKYSAELALGAAREQIAQLNRDLREVHENGQLYAAAQKLDTAAADEWADAMIGVRQIMTGLGATFALLKIGLSYVVKGLTLPMSLFRGVQDWVGKYQTGLAGLSVIVRDRLDFALKTYAYGLRSVGFGFLGDAFEWIRERLKSMGDDVSKIKSNTAGKDLAGEVNDWFRADVMAMTGRPY